MSAELDRVEKAILRSCHRMSHSVHGKPETTKGVEKATPEDVRRLQRHAAIFVGKLKRVERRAGETSKAALKNAADQTARSFSGRICALVRNADRADKRFTADQFESQAGELNISRPLHEPLDFKGQVKTDGSMRPITSPRWRRRALQVQLRDVLIAAGIDSPFEFSKQGRGALAAATTVKQAIKDGFRFWIVADVLNFFASVRPEHILPWIPVARSIVRNVAFTPQGAPILLPTKGDLTVNLSEARQGLPQGSMLSPQIASALIGRELQGLPGDRVAVAYRDDIAVGARSQQEAKDIEKALSTRLVNLAAGPLSLRYCKHYDAENRLDFLQFRLRWRHWLGDEFPHHHPNPRALRRWRSELIRRIDEYPLSTPVDDIVEDLLDGYCRNWTVAMAWPSKTCSPELREWIEAIVRASVEETVDHHQYLKSAKLSANG